MEFLRSEKLQKAIHAKHHARRHVTKDAHHCEIQRGSPKKTRDRFSQKLRCDSCRVMWTHWIGPNPGNWRKHNKTLFHRTNPFETVVFRGYPNHYKGNRFKEDTNVNHLRHRKSQVIKSYTPFQMIQTGWSCPMLLVTLLKKTKPILNPRVMWTHWIGPNPGNWRKQNKTLFNSQNPLKNFFSEDTRTVTRITSLKKIQTSTIWNTGNPKSLNHSPPFKWFLMGGHVQRCWWSHKQSKPLL